MFIAQDAQNAARAAMEEKRVGEERLASAVAAAQSEREGRVDASRKAEEATKAATEAWSQLDGVSKVLEEAVTQSQLDQNALRGEREAFHKTLEQAKASVLAAEKRALEWRDAVSAKDTEVEETRRAANAAAEDGRARLKKAEERAAEWASAMEAKKNEMIELRKALDAAKVGESNAVRLADELELVKRQAIGAAESGRARIASAEERAEEWRVAVEAKEGEMRSVRVALEEARDAATAAANAARDLEDRRRVAEASTEDMQRRLREGEARATERTKEIVEELEEIRRAAAGAAEEGNRRLRVAEDRALEWADAVKRKDVEVREMALLLDEARAAARAASDAARELDDVKRQANRAAEDGRARITDAQDKAEALMRDLRTMNNELATANASLEDAKRFAAAASASELESRAVVAEVEDLRKRLVNGQLRAEEELRAVLVDFEALKASADSAAVAGRAQIHNLKEETVSLKRELENARNSVGRAKDAEFELEEVTRNAAVAAENGGARIRAAETALAEALAALKKRENQNDFQEDFEYAKARALAAEAELEDVTRDAAEARKHGTAKILALEQEVEKGQDAYLEIQRLERIIEGEGSTGAKFLLAAELEDVKRSAARAAEKGGARIREAERELARVRKELARMAEERGEVSSSSRQSRGTGSGVGTDGEERARRIQEELDDVKRRAELAAENGRARINALELELESALEHITSLKRAQLEEHVTSLNSNERRENANRSSVADTDAAHARAKQLEAQLRDVKQRATSAATEGGKRIKAAETELMKMRRAVDAANAARAAGGNASREFELRMRDKDAELDTMRGDLREARETARANASLAVEAATRLKSAELVVTRAREAAETAATRARVSEEGASKAGLQAAAAAREKENAVRVTLAEAESRYEKFAQEARKASEEAAVAAADRDGRVELLERSLVDLETKARDAVTAAENAVFSAEQARETSENAAARAAADAAAAYSRLEGSLVRAETEIDTLEAQTLADLANVRQHQHHGDAFQYYNAAVSAGVVPSIAGAALTGVRRAEHRIAEICRLSQTLFDAIEKQGEVPISSAPKPPAPVSEKMNPEAPEVGAALRDAEATADLFEEVAAALWAQAEGLGLDPSGAVARAVEARQ